MIENQNKAKINLKEEKNESILQLEIKAPRLRAAILYFIDKIPNKLNRIKLCKHLFYADGHYFQKTGNQITEFPYLHIEGSPQPIHFNEVMHDMVLSSQIKVFPQVETEINNKEPVTVLKGLSFRALIAIPVIFSREEKKVLNSVASIFNGDLTLETRYYPNLYQQYAQTGLYEEIKFMRFSKGKRPHLIWKAWANKIFKLMWE